MEKKYEYMKEQAVRDKVIEVRMVDTIAEKTEIMFKLFHEDWDLYWKVYTVLDFWEW